MIIDAVRLAFSNLLSNETRGVLWKTLGLTILLLIVAWFALQGVFNWLAWPWLGAMLPTVPEWAGWLGVVLGVVLSVGLAIGLAMLIAPVSTLVGGFYQDEIADIIERRDYPSDRPGQALPLGQSINQTVRFFGIVVVGNIFAFALLLVPGINLVAFFLVNGFLLGREFFEFSAMRFHSPTDAKLLRSEHEGTVFLAGLAIALLLAVPVLNLMTPIFATSLMVHLHKMIEQRAIR